MIPPPWPLPYLSFPPIQIKRLYILISSSNISLSPYQPVAALTFDLLGTVGALVVGYGPVLIKSLLKDRTGPYSFPAKVPFELRFEDIYHKPYIYIYMTSTYTPSTALIHFYLFWPPFFFYVNDRYFLAT